MSDIRISGIIEETVANGPGFRFAVFAQGCSHKCPGCHNPSTHSYDGGTAVSVDELTEMLRARPELDGLTLSGGEPFDQAESCADLAEAAHGLGLDVWCWTGYVEERLRRGMAEGRRDWERLMNAIDVLVDGPFVQALASASCQWRGSTNQRIIELHKNQ